MSSALPHNMNAVIYQLEEALCWTIFAPLVRFRRRRMERKISQEFHDRKRIDDVLDAIVREHGDLLG